MRLKLLLLGAVLCLSLSLSLCLSLVLALVPQATMAQEEGSNDAPIWGIKVVNQYPHDINFLPRACSTMTAISMRAPASADCRP